MTYIAFLIGLGIGMPAGFFLAAALSLSKQVEQDEKLEACARELKAWQEQVAMMGHEV